MKKEKGAGERKIERSRGREDKTQVKGTEWLLLQVSCRLPQMCVLQTLHTVQLCHWLQFSGSEPFLANL